jgi:hypothetical protein
MHSHPCLWHAAERERPRPTGGSSGFALPTSPGVPAAEPLRAPARLVIGFLSRFEPVLLLTNVNASGTVVED